MEVVSCQWTPEVSCYVAPGYKYEYDGDVNRDHTNVRLLNATAEHVGMYTCQVIGERNPGTCSLTEEQSKIKKRNWQHLLIMVLNY